MQEQKMFARKREDDQYYDLLYYDSGEAVTILDPDLHPTVYPVHSPFSGYHEHPRGIELTLDDVKKLNIEIEDDWD